MLYLRATRRVVGVGLDNEVLSMETKKMKAWLKRLWILPVLIAVVMACFAVAEYRYSHPAEPELCALCDRGYVLRAPALLNLATGEIAEMEVYESDPSAPDGIDKTRTGVASFSFAAGVQVVMDVGRSASVILPDALKRMDYSLYCRNCRGLLSAAGTRGYVLLDLHDPDAIVAYPTREGSECNINGYTATVEKKKISAAMPEEYIEVVEVLVTFNE